MTTAGRYLVRPLAGVALRHHSGFLMASTTLIVMMGRPRGGRRDAL